MQVNERNKLIANLNMFDTGETKESVHTLFMDNEEEVANFKPAEYFDTNESLVKNTSNRLKNHQISEMKVKILTLTKYKLGSIKRTRD